VGRAAARRAAPRRTAVDHGRVLARVGLAPRRPAPPGRRPVAPVGRAVGARPEAAVVRRPRGLRRRPDDLAPRVAGRCTELGLPVRVDPGRGLHRPGVPPARSRRRSARLRPLGVRPGRLARRGRRARHGLHGRRRTPAGRDRARAPRGIRGLPARAHRERRVEPAAARRLRGDPRLGAPARAGRPGVRPRPVGDGRAPHAAGRRALGPPRQRDVGVPGRARPPRALEADVLGRPRPGAPARHRVRTDRADRPVAAGRRRGPGDDPVARVRRRTRRARSGSASTGSCRGATPA